MTPSEIAQRLNARRTADGWQAKCPGHEDKRASLSIAGGREGHVLLKCHAGCEFTDIVRAMNLEPKDLMPATNTNTRPTIAAEYSYYDHQGEMLYQVVRLEPKDFRQRRPLDGGWEWKLGKTRRVLYRLPELLASTGPVFVVEGEKDADNLAKLGLIATTNAGGASKWDERLAEPLEDREVYVLPDNDDAGIAHAEAVCKTLPRAKVVNLPDLPDKGDVSDWLNAGGSKEKLMALCIAGGFASSSVRFQAANSQRLKNIEHVIPFNVSYLDDELLGIHPNDIVIIMASTGAGKTTLGSILAEKAADNGRRVRFFALEAYQNEIEVRTLFREISSLAKAAGVLKPWMTQQRWIKRGIDALEPFTDQAIKNLEGRLGLLETYYRGNRFDRNDIRREFMASKGKADLIILDHLHYIDSDGPNENLELKKVIQVIRDCGQALGIPVIVIAHIRKAMGGPRAKRMIPGIDELHGSSDVAKIATTIIAVAPARDEEFLSDEPGVANTFMAVLKDRIGGDKGYAALMRYDLGEMSYRPAYRLCKRLGDGGVKFFDNKPGWAINAISPMASRFGKSG